MNNFSTHGARFEHQVLPARVTRERARAATQPLASQPKVLGKPAGFESDADEQELPFTD